MKNDKNSLIENIFEPKKAYSKPPLYLLHPTPIVFRQKKSKKMCRWLSDFDRFVFCFNNDSNIVYHCCNADNKLKKKLPLKVLNYFD